MDSNSNSNFEGAPTDIIQDAVDAAANLLPEKSTEIWKNVRTSFRTVVIVNNYAKNEFL